MMIGAMELVIVIAIVGGTFFFAAIVAALALWSTKGKRTADLWKKVEEVERRVARLEEAGRK